MPSEYIGEELDIFKDARHWKQYWFQKCLPHFGKTILDVGAGVGATSILCSRLGLVRYLGVEPDPNNMEVIKSKIASGEIPETFDFMIGGIEAVPQSDKFDTVLYIDVLEHIEDDHLELARAYQYLAKNGRIIVLCPAHQWLYSSFDRSVGHYRRYDKRSILSSVPDTLSIKQIYYLDSVGILASAFNRLFLKSSLPTSAQIRFWDRWLVPFSKLMDRISNYKIGKSILVVLEGKCL